MILFVYSIPVIGSIVYLLGVLMLLRIVYEGQKIIRQFLIKEDQINIEETYGKGSYVMITGGTSGIGLELAKKFASLGFNIINISRNPQKLEARAEEIKACAKHEDIKIVNIVKDFTECHKAEFYDEILERVEGLDLSILINNVGISGNSHLPLSKVEYNSISDLVVANCNSQLGMLKSFLPLLIKRSKANLAVRSGVIDMSSITACGPSNFVASYAATKAFNLYLTLGINATMKKDIDFLSVQPHFVESNMTQGLEKHPKMISAEECVNGIIGCFGVFDSTCGGKGHILPWLKCEIMRFVLGELMVEPIHPTH